METYIGPHALRLVIFGGFCFGILHWYALKIILFWPCYLSNVWLCKLIPYTLGDWAGVRFPTDIFCFVSIMYRPYTKEWCRFNSIHYWNRTILLCMSCIYWHWDASSTYLLGTGTAGFSAREISLVPIFIQCRCRMRPSLHVAIEQTWSAFYVVRATSAKFDLYAGNINSIHRINSIINYTYSFTCVFSVHRVE
jgi:hypothetical protein